MKKIAIVSMTLNAVLILTTIVLFYNYHNIKKKYAMCKKQHRNVSLIKSIPIARDKTDPAYVYESKKFPCDSKYSSYETNLCLGERLRFADSLLNVLVNSNLKEFDIEIRRDQEAVLKVPDNTYFVNSLKTVIASKENFIKAQKKWQELRVLNAEYVQIGCDGGTGCSGIVSSKEIKAVLARMKEIKERYN